MRATALLFLVGASALAVGCKPAAQPTVAEQEAARVAQTSTLKGWDRVWNAPEQTVAAANQFGYRATPYAATDSDPAFASKGGPVVIGNSFAKKPQTTAFEATGSTAAAIDRIAFSLDLPREQKNDADAAKKRFTDLIRQFLAHYGIDDEKALDAVQSETDADGQLGPQSNVPVSVAVEKQDGGARRITVTFLRADASTPANSQPQG